MAVTGEELVGILGRYPPPGDPPEAARTEAAVIVRRAQIAEKDGELAGLKVYSEALDLDPTSRAAYEAIARIVLAQGELPKNVLDASIRYFEVAQKRLAGDPALVEIVKKLRVMASPGAALEPALARPATRNIPRTPSMKPSGGPQKVCQYCGSPIPVNSPECKSCNLSGEIMKDDIRAAIRDRQKASSKLLLILFVVAVVVVAALGVAIYVRLHK